MKRGKKDEKDEKASENGVAPGPILKKTEKGEKAMIAPCETAKQLPVLRFLVSNLCARAQ